MGRLEQLKKDLASQLREIINDDNNSLDSDDCMDTMNMAFNELDEIYKSIWQYFMDPALRLHIHLMVST